MTSSRPNVVLFISHDTGRFLSPYGVKTVRTPTFERFAAEGVLFENAFATAPLCCPSRASCTTGRYPHQNGVNGLTSPLLGGWDFHPDERHAARLFADAGYESVLCGFELESPLWQNLGFSRAISGSGGWYNGGGDLRNHAREIDSFLNERDGARPFFLQIGCHETHLEWTQFETPPDESLGVATLPWLRDLPDVRREMAEFQGAVARMDQCVGEMLRVLDGRGLAEDTIVVLTTDHGIDFPRAKGTLLDAGIETFLLMRFPRDGWSAGRRVSEMVSNVDVLPTLLDAAGIAMPDNLAGRSFLPLLRGEPFTPRDRVFAEKTYHDTYDPSRAVRTATHKYIRHFEVNIFQDLRLATETRRHYLRDDWRRRHHEELYDLRSDPHERVNLATDPSQARLLKSLRSDLLQWMEQTNDPLLRGPVPSPHYASLLREFRDSASA